MKFKMRIHGSSSWWAEMNLRNPHLMLITMDGSMDEWLATNHSFIITLFHHFLFITVGDHQNHLHHSDVCISFTPLRLFIVQDLYFFRTDSTASRLLFSTLIVNPFTTVNPSLSKFLEFSILSIIRAGGFKMISMSIEIYLLSKHQLEIQRKHPQHVWSSGRVTPHSDM